MDDEICEEMPVIGFWSAFIWLIIMTLTIAILSEYVVGTIEVCIYIQYKVYIYIHMWN